MFEHPDLPDLDEGDGEKCKAWIGQQGLQLVMVHLENDAPEEIAERYFEAGEPHCGYWEPGKPEGDGWFCLAIHDTDDGPVCWWARRQPETCSHIWVKASNRGTGTGDICQACLQVRP